MVRSAVVIMAAIIRNLVKFVHKYVVCSLGSAEFC